MELGLDQILFDNFFTSMTFSFFLLYYLNINEVPNRK